MDKIASSPSFARPTPREFSEPRPAVGVVSGQVVQIQSGQLRGLNGVVVKVNEDGNCLVELSDLGPGVLVTIHARQLGRT